MSERSGQGRVVRRGHDCGVPDADGFPRGTIWRGDCGHRWVVVTDWRENPETGRAFRRALWPAWLSRRSAR